MQIVPVDLALEVHARNVEPRSPADAPVAVDPAAVHADTERRGQQAKQRPVEGIIDDLAIANFRRVLERRVERNDCFVGDGGVVERQRTGEKSVAGNAVSMCGVAAGHDGQRHQCHRQPPRQHHPPRSSPACAYKTWYANAMRRGRSGRKKLGGVSFRLHPATMSARSVTAF
jgi:hypothetical protein